MAVPFITGNREVRRPTLKASKRQPKQSSTFKVNPFPFTCRSFRVSVPSLACFADKMTMLLQILPRYRECTPLPQSRITFFITASTLSRVFPKQASKYGVSRRGQPRGRVRPLRRGCHFLRRVCLSPIVHFTPLTPLRLPQGPRSHLLLERRSALSVRQNMAHHRQH